MSGGSYQDLERQIWGVASQPAGGGVPAPEQVAQFNNSLAWIVKALRLQASTPPGALEISAITPVLDAFQGGWPYAKYVAPANAGLSFLGPIVTFANGVGVVAADNTLVQRLMAFEISNTGGGGALSMVFRLGTVPNAVGGVSNAAIAQATMAPGATLTMVDIFGARDIVVPPGLTLTVDGGGAALAAGQLVNFVGGVIQQIPAGFHI